MGIFLMSCTSVSINTGCWRINIFFYTPLKAAFDSHKSIALYPINTFPRFLYKSLTWIKNFMCGARTKRSGRQYPCRNTQSVSRFSFFVKQRQQHTQPLTATSQKVNFIHSPCHQHTQIYIWAFSESSRSNSNLTI